MDAGWLEGRRADDVQWLRPSPRLTTMRQTEVGLITLFASLIAAGVVWSAASPLWAVVAFAGVIASGVVTGWLVTRRVRSWGYAERDDDLLVQHGLLVSRLSVVPYGRMQFIDVTAGPAERAFGIVTVKLHTAAAASDARIPGLDAGTGTALRDRLASLGEARASGL